MINKPLFNHEFFPTNNDEIAVLRLLPPLPGENWFEVVTTVDASGRPRYCHPVIIRGKEFDGPRIWTVPQGMHDRIVDGMLQPTEITTTTEPYYGEGMNPWLRYPYLWVRQVFWYLFPRRQTVTISQKHPVNDPLYGRDFHLIRQKMGSVWTYDQSYFAECTSPIDYDSELMKVILAQRRSLKELVSTFPPLKVHEEHVKTPKDSYYGSESHKQDIAALMKAADEPAWSQAEQPFEQTREELKNLCEEVTASARDAIQVVSSDPAPDLSDRHPIPVPKGRETILANLGEQKMQVGYGFLPGTISAFCSGIHPRHSKEYIRSGALTEKLVDDKEMEADEINRIPPVPSLIAVTDIEPVKANFERFYDGDVPKHTVDTLPDAAPSYYSHWIMEEQGTSATYNMYKSPNRVPVIRLLTSYSYLDYLASHASEGDTVEYRNASGKINYVYRIQLIQGRTVWLNFTGEHTEKSQHQYFAPRRDPQSNNLEPYEWQAIDDFIYPRVGDTYKVVRNWVNAYYPDTTCRLLPGSTIVVSGYDLTNFNEPRISYNVNFITHGISTNTIPIADCEWVPPKNNSVENSFSPAL